MFITSFKTKSRPLLHIIAFEKLQGSLRTVHLATNILSKLPAPSQHPSVEYADTEYRCAAQQVLKSILQSKLYSM